MFQICKDTCTIFPVRVNSLPPWLPFHVRPSHYSLNMTLLSYLAMPPCVYRSTYTVLPPVNTGSAKQLSAEVGMEGVAVHVCGVGGMTHVTL